VEKDKTIGVRGYAIVFIIDNDVLIVRRSVDEEHFRDAVTFNKQQNTIH
jgi:hypothetical protein